MWYLCESVCWDYVGIYARMSSILHVSKQSYFHPDLFWFHDGCLQGQSLKHHWVYYYYQSRMFLPFEFVLIQASIYLGITAYFPYLSRAKDLGHLWVCYIRKASDFKGSGTVEYLEIDPDFGLNEHHYHIIGRSSFQIPHIERNSCLVWDRGKIYTWNWLA